jgi:hypothetical protein
VGAVEVLQTEILPLLLRALDTDLSAALTALLPSMRQVSPLYLILLSFSPVQSGGSEN